MERRRDGEAWWEGDASRSVLAVGGFSRWLLLGRGGVAALLEEIMVVVPNSKPRNEERRPTPSVMADRGGRSSEFYSEKKIEASWV